jgi:hypothetical protein
MEEIIARAECYINVEESNAEKKARDVKERNTNNSERKNYHPPASRDWHLTESRRGDLMHLI